MKTILARIFYYIGDMISYPMHWWALGLLYPIYNQLMTWSITLDPSGEIWEIINEENEDKNI